MPSNRKKRSTRNTREPQQNRLLLKLPKAEYARLEPHLTRLALTPQQILYEPDVPIKFIYFPINGIVSMITIMENGMRSEVGTIGDEGFVGLPVFLGAESIPGQAFAQVPGDAWQLTVSQFKIELGHNGHLRSLLNLYTQALFTQLAQSVSCNRVHKIEQRCARWLLMTHDRVGKDQFILTQEFLAQMLGVRRASVTEVAQKLHKAGAIRYSRGTITVISRAILEAMSCECYQVIRDQYDHLLG
jgi:CRP-like cAMP-binding protein